MRDRKMVLIARHGQTNWNLERRVQGSSNTTLNVRGIRQSLVLAEHLDLMDVPIKSVWSSDLARAEQTAVNIANRLDATLEFSERLRECEFGEIEGKTFEEVQAFRNGVFAEQLRDPARYNFTDIGGEDSRTVLERMSTGIQASIDNIELGEMAVIISHGKSISTFLSYHYPTFPQVRHNCEYRILHI